jgi:hypothetical protein
VTHKHTAPLLAVEFLTRTLHRIIYNESDVELAMEEAA